MTDDRICANCGEWLEPEDDVYCSGVCEDNDRRYLDAVWGQSLLRGAYRAWRMIKAISDRPWY